MEADRGAIRPQKGFRLQKWSQVPMLVQVKSPVGSCGALGGSHREITLFEEHKNVSQDETMHFRYVGCRN